MRFQTPTNQITVVVGKQAIKVDTRDPRLREIDFKSHVVEISATKARLCIFNNARTIDEVARSIGRVQYGTKLEPGRASQVLNLRKMTIVFPDGHEVSIDPGFSFLFMVYIETIESQSITIRLAVNEQTAAWYGRVVVIPFQPPTEVAPTDIAASADEGEDNKPAPADSAATIDTDAVLDKHIDELELSVRAANYLQNTGIETVRQIVEQGLAGLLSSKNFGKKSA
jgi:hypothetical protein